MLNSSRVTDLLTELDCVNAVKRCLCEQTNLCDKQISESCPKALRELMQDWGLNDLVKNLSLS